jgi:hypothetical protein
MTSRSWSSLDSRGLAEGTGAEGRDCSGCAEVRTSSAGWWGCSVGGLSGSGGESRGV